MTESPADVVHQVSQVIRITRHAKERIRERGAKGSGVVKYQLDIAKSIDRFRVFKHYGSNRYVVVGGLGTYIMSNSLQVITVLDVSRDNGPRKEWKPLNDYEKMKLLERIKRRISRLS